MPPDIFLLSSRNIDGKFSWTFGKRCGIMRSKGAENMDFQHIHKLMEELNNREIPEEIRQKIEDEFEIDYTYDSLIRFHFRVRRTSRDSTSEKTVTAVILS